MDVDREDWLENDRSLERGFRILSVYHGSGGTRFRIVTEADRSIATVLPPSDY